VKLGGYVDPADLVLMQLASEALGAPVDVVMSLALSWGCQRLRDTCPYELPPEAMTSAPAPRWAS